METLFIEPGGPWENGSVESFNGKLRDEFLDCEILSNAVRNEGLDRTMATQVQDGAATHIPAALAVDDSLSVLVARTIDDLMTTDA